MGVGCVPLDAWDGENFKEGLPEFNRNWWGWRPLWNFVYENSDGIITERQHAMGHSNCGDLLDEATCKKLAERLKGLKVPPRQEPAVKTITPQMTNEKASMVMESWYGFDQEDLDEFIEFLSKSNGMAIY